MNYSEGILLGLSTGAVCLAYCGPVLIPYLMGENKGVKTNFAYVSLFLSGRLLAYLVIGLVAGVAGTYIFRSSELNVLIFGFSYVILSVLLIAYGFYRFKEVCLGNGRAKVAYRRFGKMPYLIPVVGGFMTGVNICPPLLLAFTKAASTQDVAGSVLFFLMFFIGTSLFFIPLPFLGLFQRQKALRTIGKFAAIIAGAVYLYKGILIIISN